VVSQWYHSGSIYLHKVLTAHMYLLLGRYRAIGDASEEDRRAEGDRLLALHEVEDHYYS
jgi:hypothetical protein